MACKSNLLYSYLLTCAAVLLLFQRIHLGEVLILKLFRLQIVNKKLLPLNC